MRRSRTQWTTAMAAAALFMLPIGAKAQTPSTPQTPAAAAQPSQQAATPQDHLQQAESALQSISPTAVTGEAKTKIAELKKHLNALKSAASASDAAAARDDKKWASEAAAMDRILTELLGTGATTGAVGTSGTTGAKADAVTIDEDTRGKLNDVRTHVTAFAASMSGAAPTASSAASPTPAAERPSPAAAATEPTAQTSPSQPPTAQANQGEARRHLTMARESLSQLTQLPAASQLSGETRQQVSQLITNFNELITTNADWKASYAKVDANLMALLGAPAGDEPPTAVPPTPASPTGTPGAVGTAGSTGLDPAIRAKLMEFRGHLKEFEKAAGGSAPAPASASSTPTPNPAAASPSTPESAAAPNPAGDDAMRHVTAIETILNGAGGDSVTLDRAQLEQLRTHLALLKQIVEKK